MEALVTWYQSTLGQFCPKELFVFIVSMMPFIELRGGLVIASLLKIPLIEANIICILGNIVPIPIIVVFVRGVFDFMKKHHILVGLIEKIENRAMKKSKGVERGESLFLFLFTGIPIPGTGVWMGSLIATLLDFRIVRAILSMLAGLVLATVIMDLVSYGILSNILSVL